MAITLFSMAAVCASVAATILSRGDGPAAGPSFHTVVPNLVVTDIEASLAFYRDVLGFTPDMRVPDTPPYVFVSVRQGDVQIFLNDREAVGKDFPALAGRPPGGGNTMYVRMTGVEEYHGLLKARTRIIMPLVRQPYGMTEFAVSDPDGYVIFFAEERGR